MDEYEDYSDEPETVPADWAGYLALSERGQADVTLSAIDAVVEHMPEDYIYTGACKYIRRGGDEAGCLVGQVLHRLGASINMLAALDEDSDPRIAQQWPALQLSRTVGVMLSAAQNVQDAQQPWRAARQAAHGVYEGLIWHIDD